MVPAPKTNTSQSSSSWRARRHAWNQPPFPSLRRAQPCALTHFLPHSSPSQVSTRSTRTQQTYPCPHLGRPGVSKAQPLKEGGELVEGCSTRSFPLSPCPFHPSWGPETPLLGEGKVKPVGQHPPSPTASKLGNLVAGTKQAFVGFLSCLGGCSRPRHSWAGHAQLRVASPHGRRSETTASPSPCLRDRPGQPGTPAQPELRAGA